MHIPRLRVTSSKGKLCGENESVEQKTKVLSGAIRKGWRKAGTGKVSHRSWVRATPGRYLLSFQHQEAAEAKPQTLHSSSNSFCCSRLPAPSAEVSPKPSLEMGLQSSGVNSPGQEGPSPPRGAHLKGQHDRYREVTPCGVCVLRSL